MFRVYSGIAIFTSLELGKHFCYVPRGRGDEQFHATVKHYPSITKHLGNTVPLHS